MLSSDDWRQIIDFIDERDPGFRTRIRGASRERVAELQAIHTAKLPRAYVDFLSLLGEDHGGFELSWAHYSTIGELLEHNIMPLDAPLSYPRSRFVWIAGMKDEYEDDASGWGDYYLDLTRGEREDPTLIDHEFFEPYTEAPEIGHVIGLRFTDYIQKRVYADYEMDSKLYQYRVSLSFSVKEATAVWKQLHRLFRWMKWRSCLPGSDNTWFGLHAEPGSLEAIRGDGMIHLHIGANDRKRVLTIAEEIEDEFPTRTVGGSWFKDGDAEWTT